MVDQSAKLAVRDMLAEVLSAAASQREQRRGVVEAASGYETEWVVYEREQMLAAVNQHRREIGMPAVTIAHVEQIDCSAAGHVDWFEKFTLRCAALAVGEE